MSKLLVQFQLDCLYHALKACGVFRNSLFLDLVYSQEKEQKPGLFWGTFRSCEKYLIRRYLTAQTPSAPLEPRATLPAESPDTRKGPHRIPHVILRPLVSGTQLLPGVWFEHQISGYLPCKKRACLQRILCPLKLRRVLPSRSAHRG